MSFNIDLWNKCQKCNNLKRKSYLHNNEIVYSYVCKYRVEIGKVNCNKFENKCKI